MIKFEEIVQGNEYLLHQIVDCSTTWLVDGYSIKPVQTGTKCYGKKDNIIWEFEYQQDKDTWFALTKFVAELL